MTLKTPVHLAILNLLAFAPALAQTSSKDGITVTGAWSRATLSMEAGGAVYLNVTDTGAPDRLIGVATPVAATAELHQTKTVNQVTEMRAVDNLPVRPGQPLSLAPDGYHIMLMGLKKKLAAGETFPLTLTFAHAGPITTTVSIRSLTGAPMMNMGNMKP